MFSRESSLVEPIYPKTAIGCPLIIIFRAITHTRSRKNSSHGQTTGGLKPAAIWLMILIKQYTQPRPCIQEKDKPVCSVIKAKPDMHRSRRNRAIVCANSPTCQAIFCKGRPS
jgi:hypothetical protein